MYPQQYFWVKINYILDAEEWIDLKIRNVGFNFNSPISFTIFKLSSREYSLNLVAENITIQRVSDGFDKDLICIFSNHKYFNLTYVMIRNLTSVGNLIYLK